MGKGVVRTEEVRYHAQKVRETGTAFLAGPRDTGGHSCPHVGI